MGKPAPLPQKAVDKLNALKKEQVVELYRQFRGNITLSCQTAEISRTTYYKWLETDQAFQQAIIDAEAELNDEIRDVLVGKAGEGDMTAVIFYLKSRHPDFKQNNGFIQQINVGKEMKVDFLDAE